MTNATTAPVPAMSETDGKTLARLRVAAMKVLWKLICSISGNPNCTKAHEHPRYVGKSPAEQHAKFAALIPKLKEVRPSPILLAGIEAGIVRLPAGAEDWFAIPHWSLVAKNYPEAVEFAFELYRKSSGYEVRWAEGGKNWGSVPIEQYREKAQFMDQLMENQGSGMVVFAAQFGEKRTGLKRHQVHQEVDPAEHALGAYEILMMLVAHPDRLAYADDLGVECSGDQYVRRDGHYCRGTLQIVRSMGEVKSTNANNCDKDWSIGSPTAFAPAVQ